MSNKFKIILITPGNLSNQDSEGGRGVVYSPNLGLTYLASYIEKLYGDRVEVAIIETVPEQLSDADVRERIVKFSPDMVGISSKTFNILSAYRLLRMVKSIDPTITTLLGGAHGTAMPEHTIDECRDIDIIVRGEGELPFAAIVGRALENRLDDLEGIAAVTYRTKAGEVKSNSGVSLLKDLDVVPFPRYDKYDLKNYGIGHNPVTGAKENFFSVFASRGCPYFCTFCMPLLTRQVRKREPAMIVEELNFLIEEMGAKFVYFEDSCMTTDNKWFEAVCDEFLRAGINKKLSWGFETRVDVVTKKLFDKAVSAGGVYVNFGLESGSDYILECNKKNFKTKDILHSVRIAREAGMTLIHGSFILGLPFETHKTIQETLNFVEKLDIDMIPINIVDIYPGSELFNMVERGEGGIHWLPGLRYNWEIYERNKCQTEVNDLTEADLMKYYKQALELVEKKTGMMFTI